MKTLTDFSPSLLWMLIYLFLIFLIEKGYREEAMDAYYFSFNL
jgi:hypothetical protein